MKCEGFSMISDLVDYLNNNLFIAHYCGFDITIPLPYYWTFDCFLIKFDNEILSKLMKSQVLSLSDKGIIDTSFIGLDSSPITANTSQNNHKSFSSNKFNANNQPNADSDCNLGVHSASNRANDLPSTVKANIFKIPIHFAQNASVTIHVLKTPVRNACG